MKGEENAEQWKFSLPMGLERLWHGSRDDVELVGDGVDLYDHLLGSDRRGINLSHPMAGWDDEDHTG